MIENGFDSDDQRDDLGDDTDDFELDEGRRDSRGRFTSGNSFAARGRRKKKGGVKGIDDAYEIIGCLMESKDERVKLAATKLLILLEEKQKPDCDNGITAGQHETLKEFVRWRHRSGVCLECDKFDIPTTPG